MGMMHHLQTPFGDPFKHHQEDNAPLSSPGRVGGDVQDGVQHGAPPWFQHHHETAEDGCDESAPSGALCEQSQDPYVNHDPNLVGDRGPREDDHCDMHDETTNDSDDGCDVSAPPDALCDQSQDLCMHHDSNLVGGRDSRDDYHCHALDLGDGLSLGLDAQACMGWETLDASARLASFAEMDGQVEEPNVSLMLLRQASVPFSEECIFGDVNAASDRDMREEATKVLSQAFPSCIDALTHDGRPNLDQLVEIVRDKSNYEITGVTRVMNRTRQSMHAHFKKCYNITNERTVFHGTSRASADSITKTGFRGAVCQRAKFGKGIYTSSSVWEALAYAEPAEGDLTQTVLAVKLLQGPTTMGRQDMADFGTDEHGNEILTATNPEETIFCASHEDQLLATYRISVRHLPGRKHTPAHHNLVRIYHPTIWNRIKGQTAPAVPPAVFSLPPPARPPTDLLSHAGHRVQDTVTILKTFKTHAFCQGLQGTIKKIIKDGHVRFFVELDDVSLGAKVERANESKELKEGQQKNWISCTVSQLTSPDKSSSAIIIPSSKSLSSSNNSDAVCRGGDGAGHTDVLAAAGLAFGSHRSTAETADVSPSVLGKRPAADGCNQGASTPLKKVVTAG